MGSKGGGTQSTQTIQKADPPAFMQPYIQDVLAMGATNARTPQQFFPGSTVAGTAPETTAAQILQANRAIAGSPLERAAQAENLRTVNGTYFGLNPSSPYNTAAASGAFLNSNPYLDAMFARAARPVTMQFTDVALPGVASMFSSAGRYGSGAMQDATQRTVDTFGRTLGDLSANIYGTNYANERQLQNTAAQNLDQAFGRERLLQSQAVGQAPTLANQDFANIGALSEVGAQREAAQQAIINDAIQRWNFAQMEPAQRLQLYNAIVQGGFAAPSTTSAGTTQLPPRQPLRSAAGGAVAGAATGAAMGGQTGGMWGAGVGGLLGLLGMI